MQSKKLKQKLKISLFWRLLLVRSLAGRLMDVSEAMINCYEEPEMVHIVLEKATKFLIDYISAYKEAGADGILMAEPLA